jgi:hypothetical protein
MPKPKKMSGSLEKRLLKVANNFPRELVPKLVVRYFASLNPEDDLGPATEALQEVLEGAWLYKGIDSECNLEFSVNIGDEEKSLLIEETSLSELLRTLWEELQFVELGSIAGPRAAETLREWADVFDGKKEAPEK